MIRAYVDFSRKIREWDGFGVIFANKNCNKQTLEPTLFDCNNGYISEPYQKKTVELLFGNNGLRVPIIKTFLNCPEPKQNNFKSNENDPIDINEYAFNPLDNATAEFFNSAAAASAQWGGALQMLCTYTNPPGWMTKQKVAGGKDLEPSHRIDYARSMVAGIKYLVQKQFPVHFLSIHHHGEDWERWCGGESINSSGLLSLYWPPEQVVDFLKLLRRMLDKNGLGFIGLTPGEIGNWLRFVDWGYSNAIIDDPAAIQSLGLLTSTSLTTGSDPGNLVLVNSSGIDEIREQRSDIHAWFTELNPVTQITSYLMQIRNLIYNSKVNAVILGDAINLSCDTYDSALTTSGAFYYLKLFCRSGLPGTAICQVACNTKGASLIGFAGNAKKNCDAFIVINSGENEYDLPIEIRGSANGIFSVYRTSTFEKYQNIGNIHVKEGKILFKALPFSATAFFGSI